MAEDARGHRATSNIISCFDGIFGLRASAFFRVSAFGLRNFLRLSRATATLRSRRSRLGGPEAFENNPPAPVAELLGAVLEALRGQFGKQRHRFERSEQDQILAGAQPGYGIVDRAARRCARSENWSNVQLQRYDRTGMGLGLGCGRNVIALHGLNLPCPIHRALTWVKFRPYRRLRCVGSRRVRSVLSG